LSDGGEVFRTPSTEAIPAYLARKRGRFV